jgi:hypothetical protein
VDKDFIKKTQQKPDFGSYLRQKNERKIYPVFSRNTVFVGLFDEILIHRECSRLPRCFLAKKPTQNLRDRDLE